MPLQTTQAAFRLTGGVDTKTDPKAVVQGKLLSLTNGVFTSPGRIRKRNGFAALGRGIAYFAGVKLGQTFEDGGFGAAQALMTYRGELLAGSGSELFSYAPSSRSWVGKGTVHSAYVTKRSVVADTYNITGQDGAVHADSGLEAYIYNGGTGATAGVYYTVVDGSTGQTVVQPTFVAAFSNRGRVVVVNNVFVFYWYNYALTRLYCATIPVGNPQKTFTPVALTSTTPDQFGINTVEPAFDVAVITSAAVGTQIYLAFNNASTSNGLSLWRFNPTDPTSAVSHGTLQVQAERGRCITLFKDAYLDRVVLAYWNGSGVWFRTYEPALCDASDVPQIVAFGLIETTSSCLSITGASSLTTSTYLEFFYTVSSEDEFTGLPLQTVRYAAITQTYTISAFWMLRGAPWCELDVTPQDFLRGVGLAGKAFVYAGTSYVPLVYDQFAQYDATGQSTYFIADSSGAFVARYLSGSAAAQASVISESTLSITYVGPGTALVAILVDGVATAYATGGTSAALASSLRTTINADTWASQFVHASVGSAGATSTVIITAKPGATSRVTLLPVAALATVSLSESVVQSGSAPAMLPGTWSTDSTTFRVAQLSLHDGGASTGVGAFVSGMTSIAVDFFQPELSYRRGELAQNLHVSGGFLSMYDGKRVVEHGFFLYPEKPYCTDSAGTTYTYQYVALYEWIDNQGQIHRSAPSEPLTVITDTEIGETYTVTLEVAMLRLTAKQGYTATAPRIVVYRTLNNGTVFHRSSLGNTWVNDPSEDYIEITDASTDDEIEAAAQVYTTGGTVENIAPPPVGSLVVHRNRLFVLDSTNPLVINYSQLVQPGAPVEFSDGTLQFMADPVGGDVEALGSLDDKLILFRRSSIGYVTGIGPDSKNEQSDFSDVIGITTACGCLNPRSVVTTPAGLMFQSTKGIYLITRDLSVMYVGAGVEAFNEESVTSAVLVPNANQVRFTLGNRTALVYDYFMTDESGVGQWSVFTNLAAVDSTIWNGLHTYLRDDGTPFEETPGVFTDGGSHIPLGFTTSWLQFAGVQGFQRVREMLVLGEYYGPHKLQIQVAYDFDPGIKQTKLITPVAPTAYGDDSPYGSGSPYGGTFPLYQWKLSFNRQKTDAVQITLVDVPDGAPGESMSLSALSFEVASKGRLRTTGPSRSV